jgi:HAMP domain-containing protein
MPEAASAAIGKIVLASRNLLRPISAIARLPKSFARYRAAAFMRRLHPPH